LFVFELLCFQVDLENFFRVDQLQTIKKAPNNLSKQKIQQNGIQAKRDLGISYFKRYNGNQTSIYVEL
jgi:hypothetical protein